MPVYGPRVPRGVMSDWFTSAFDILIDIVAFLIDPVNFYFSAFFYITFVFAVFCLLFSLFRRS